MTNSEVNRQCLVYCPHNLFCLVAMADILRHMHASLICIGIGHVILKQYTVIWIYTKQGYCNSITTHVDVLPRKSVTTIYLDTHH